MGTESGEPMMWSRTRSRNRKPDRIPEPGATTGSRSHWRSRWARAVALAALLALASGAAPARALTLTVTGGGLTEGASFACPSGATLCEPSSDFGFVSDADVQGTIEIVGSALSVDIQIGSARFEALVPSGLPGDVEGVDFSGLAYSGDATVAVTDVAGILSAIAYTAGAGSVGGSVATEDAGSAPVDPAAPFSLGTPLTNVNCLLSAGTGQCSLQFGRSGFTLGLGGEAHDFVHVLNVTVVPEPATALLLACAGGWLVARARRVGAGR